MKHPKSIFEQGMTQDSDFSVYARKTQTHVFQYHTESIDNLTKRVT